MDTALPPRTLGSRLRRALGFGNLDAKLRRRQELIDAGEYDHPYPAIEALVHRSSFENATGAVITIACVLIAVHGDLVIGLSPSDPRWLLEVMVALAMAAELSLRVLGFGWPWLVSAAHLTECIIVGFALLHCVLALIDDPEMLRGAKLLRKLTILRAARLPSVATTLRKYPAFKGLALLTYSLQSAWPVLLAAGLLIAAVVYVGAVLIVEIIALSSDTTTDVYLQSLIGTVPDALMTLFRLATLDRWTDVLRPLMYTNPGAIVILLLFVLFTAGGVFQCVVAVLVDRTLEAGEREERILKMERLQKREEESRKLMELFRDLDEDGGGTIDRMELDAAVQHPQVRAMLAVASSADGSGVMSRRELEAELDHLWAALDNGDGQLTIDEFVNGLTRLGSAATARDVMRLAKELREVERKIDEGVQYTATVDQRVDELMGELSKMQENMALLLRLAKSIERSILPPVSP